MTSRIEKSGISLNPVPSRTYLKLHKISVTPMLVKKVIIDLDSSKASGADCIPVVIQKNCGPGLLYIPAELFKMCLKLSCFPDCCKVSVVMLERVLVLKTTALLDFFHWLVKTLKNLEKWACQTPRGIRPFYFRYGFRSSRSTAYLLTVTFNSIARAFGCSIFKAFERVWYTSLLHNHEIQGLTKFKVGCLTIFCLFSVINGFRWFWLGSLCKNM